MAKAKDHQPPALKNPKLGDYHVVLPDGYAPGGHEHGSQKSFTSTRTAVHRDRTIKIRTTYRIEIDGEPLMLHTEVLDDGTVHCHGLPNYSFRSAIDLARSIIDAAALSHVDRDELGAGDGGHGGHGGHGEHGHGHGHGHGSGHGGGH